MALSLAPVAAMAQQVLSPRTAIALSAEVADAGAARAKGTQTAAVTAYVTIDPSVTSWQELGLAPATQSGNTAAVRLTPASLAQLAARRGVTYIQLTSAPRQMLDVARSECGIDGIHDGSVLSQPYTGKGVVVGIVDAGFDYTHSAFRNPADGSLRIKRVWEQKASALDGAKAPEKFGYGIELDTPELIEASQGDTDANSHGTHVAGIAAGIDAYRDGAFLGTAPDADIVLVALDLDNSSSADICNAVRYVFDYADEVGKPCVVNLSLGNHEGPHDGSSSFDTMTDAMQGAGRLIVGAAGNHRTDKFHIDRRFSSAGDQPLQTFVKYCSGPSATKKGGSIEIWGDAGTGFTVDISAYNTFSKKTVSSAAVYPAEGVSEVSFDRYATGSWKVASEVSPLNGKTHVVLSSELTNIRVNHAIAITVTPKGEGRVNMWADNTWLQLESLGIDGFSEPDAASSTLAEIGGTAKRILSVGSYTTRNEYTTNTSSGTLGETVGDISSFSSYGPTADGRIKPEVAAPGCFIISALSNNDSSGSQMYADWYDNYGRTNIYGYMQGTSMAAPFVAGVVAMWLQACPELTPEQLKQVVAATARQDAFASDQPDNNWGYGKINALGGLQECIALATAGCTSLDAPFDGEVRVAGGRVEICSPRAASLQVSVASVAGSTVCSHSFANMSAGETVSMPLPQLAKGVYLLNVTSKEGASAYKFAIQ